MDLAWHPCRSLPSLRQPARYPPQGMNYTVNFADLAFMAPVLCCLN